MNTLEEKISSRKRSSKSSKHRPRSRSRSRSPPGLQRLWTTPPSSGRKASAYRSLGMVTRNDLWSAIVQLQKSVDTMNTKFDDMMERLERIEAHPTSATTATKIPPVLTALVRHTYKSLTDLQWQVEPEDKFRSDRNEVVTRTVMGTITDSEPQWDTILIRRACNRAFESYKANKKQDLKGNKQDVKRRKTLTSRRDQLFKKRVKAGQRILSQDDCGYLCGADASFISDEDSGEDKTTYTFASPKWRATRLSTIMETCQKELDNNRKKGVEPRSTHIRKNSGEYSKRLPPSSEKTAIYLLSGEFEEASDEA